MNNKFSLRIDLSTGRPPFAAAAFLVLSMLALLPGCRQSEDAQASSRISQELEESRTKTDNLRNAMRFLDQMTPMTRDNFIEEVQLQLNTWLKDADRSIANYSATRSLGPLPPEGLKIVEADNPLSLRFGYWDIDYLFECRTMKSMADWIVDFEFHDSIIAEFMEGHREELGAAEMLKLEEAQKLFDWTVRNIRLQEFESLASRSTDSPTQLPEDAIPVGCEYLPWETTLFCEGDFVERGRIFTALATQRGIDTYWVALDAADGKPGKLWAIAAAVGEHLFLFEPKHGFPIVDPDNSRLATLKDAITNDRILRRLNLPGQFEYAYDQKSLKDIKLLVDAVPCVDSARMKMLQASLVNEERMVVYRNFDSAIENAKKLAPEVSAELWQVPLLAQLQAVRQREIMRTLNENSRQYMAKHAVWLTGNPVAEGRFRHMQGKFENTDAGDSGALKLYIDARVDDQRIAQLDYSPEIREELGVKRMPNEPMEEYAMRVRQAQTIFTSAKRDADFLLGQLLFDRNKLSGARDALTRVIGDPKAERWHAAAHYTLARVEAELGNYSRAAEELIYKPSTQEAGNRIRLRYVRRKLDQ